MDDRGKNMTEREIYLESEVRRLSNALKTMIMEMAFMRRTMKYTVESLLVAQRNVLGMANENAAREGFIHSMDNPELQI